MVSTKVRAHCQHLSSKGHSQTSGTSKHTQRNALVRLASNRKCVHEINWRRHYQTSDCTSTHMTPVLIKTSMHWEHQHIKSYTAHQWVLDTSIVVQKWLTPRSSILQEDLCSDERVPHQRLTPTNTKRRNHIHMQDDKYTYTKMSAQKNYNGVFCLILQIVFPPKLGFLQIILLAFGAIIDFRSLIFYFRLVEILSLV